MGRRMLVAALIIMGLLLVIGVALGETVLI
jgi:hypothetical protein